MLFACASTSAAQSEPVAVKPPYVRPVMDSLADSTLNALPDSGQAVPPNCWRPRRSPPCPGFFLTELGIEAPVKSTRVRDRRALDGTLSGPRSDIRERIVWTFGFMGTRNANSHGGVVSLMMEVDQPSLRVPYALEYRYRRWLRGNSALDLGGGYLQTMVWKDGEGWRTGNGVTMLAGYTFNDWVALSARGDLIPAAGRTRSALHLGVRSTRLSEGMLRLTALAAWHALLGAIGFEPDEE